MPNAPIAWGSSTPAVATVSQTGVLTARTAGTTIVLVDPAYTSQTCHACTHVDPKNRESQAVFACTACGHQAHADVNAAKNILNAAGHAVSGRGDLGTGRSVKRQPPATRTRTGRSPRDAGAAGIPVP